MKIRILGAFLAPLFALGVAACDVDQTEEGDMPEVNVEGGNLPEYDVDVADVKVGTDTQQVIVPDVDVTDPDANDTTTTR